MTRKFEICFNSTIVPTELLNNTIQVGCIVCNRVEFVKYG